MAARMAQSKKSIRKAAAAARPRATPVAAGADSAAKGPAPVVEQPAAPPATGIARAKVLQLGASLSIREVGEYALQLKGLLTGGPLEIDARLLESIDTAGIQLLLVAAASAQRRGFKLKLLGAQGVRTGAAQSLGLDEHLGELAEILP
jgi:anti-anti-sigma regulatory factor